MPLPHSRVALFVPRNHWSLRAGVVRHAVPPVRWDFITFERNDEGFAAARRWKPHGAVGQFGRDDLIRRARTLRGCIINVHGGRGYPGIAQVGADHLAVGRMAAGHLESLGLDHFAYYPFPGQDINRDRRLGGFIDALDKSGRRPHLFDPKGDYPPCSEVHGEFIQSDDELLHRWLASLPKPVGIMVPGDLLAVRIITACLHLEIPVPEQVAVIGVGDIPEFCYDCQIPVSSVALPWESIGYESAVLLDRLMQGRSVPDQPVLYPPSGITVRQSTNMLYLADRQVGEALRFIRENACRRINVEDVLARVPMGRRMLERRFRQLLKRTPHEEIHRVRIERAAKLLLHTNLTLEAIAEEAGFCGAARLSTDFKRWMKESPRDYRRRIRQAGTMPALS